MYNDEDCIDISGLQHLVYCERQWGLIHLEEQWSENYLTAAGRVMHERVDSGYKEFRKGIRQYSSLYIKSLRYGIKGIADLVEAIKQTDNSGFEIPVLKLKGKWTLYPVEFKHGKPKEHNADKVQLCAQAICLEEMTSSSIQCGAVFYGQIKRRDEIYFTDELRNETISVIQKAHELLQKGVLPSPDLSNNCKSCSMYDICMPNIFASSKLQTYRKELLG